MRDTIPAVFAFAGSSRSVPTELPPASPAAIAAEIAMTAKHAAAEAALAELRARREAIKIQTEAVVIRRDSTGVPSRGDSVSLAALQRDRLAVEAEINAARTALGPLRAAHGARVAAALAARCAAAAAEGLRALAALRGSAAELAAIATAINRAAGNAAAHNSSAFPGVALPDLGGVELEIRRLLRRATV